MRDALVQALQVQSKAASTASAWVTRWQGTMQLPEAANVAAHDPRLAHLLDKHLR